LQIARLERATLAELQRSLRRHETHIFHFIGHGKYEASANDGLLLLEREDGSSHVLSGQYLGPVLNNHAALRLVVLNACEGARTGASDPYAGAAQSLVQQGIPAVVAMQFEISDQAAITFAGEFYGALADGLPVDAALVQARTAIFAQGNDIEWGTPVYFTRSPDGRIFDLPAAAPEPASPIAGPVAPPEPEQAPSRPAKAARRAFFARLSSQGWAILVGALVMTVIGILVASGLVIQNYQSMASDNATATVQALEVQLSSRATATQLARQSLQLTASAGKPATAQPAASPQPGSDLPPQTAAPGETWRAPADGMALVYIPAGAFWMGSAQDSAISEPDEQPQHKVTLSAFWIDRSEVTNAMYALCVQAKACTPPGETGSFGLDSYYDGAGYGDYPVIHVSWYQASQYCAWAGRRLPSEAEWEKAARGGLEQALYPWGDQQPDCSRANFDNNGVVCNNDPVQVGSYPPNGYGLFDMAGNVWEWVNDWYGPYTAAEANDPDGAPQGEQRLLRGGAWNVLGQDLRVAVRLGFEPVNTSMVAGFRCALPAAGQAGQ
jgi:formylglycine-generating enzyme required for sulfatase activity